MINNDKALFETEIKNYKLQPLSVTMSQKGKLINPENYKSMSFKTVIDNTDINVKKQNDGIDM